MISRNSVLCVLLLLFATFGFCSFSIAQDETSSDPMKDLLVNPDWLADNINDVRIISSGQTSQEFAEGHIPNAVFVDWRTQIIDSSNPSLFALPPKSQLEKLLSDLGVTPEMTIVLTDNRSNRISTRLFWSLKIYGHKSVKILDGGINAWKSAGMTLSRDALKYKPTNYKFLVSNKKFAAENFASTEEVRNSVEQGDILIDGRPEKQFSGAVPGRVFHTDTPHQRKGHIKSALNIPWQENFTADGKFKSIEALRKIYQDAGVTDDQQVITYCNEGLHAAPTWFVLKELLGYPNVKLYDDSMGVWANRPDTPMSQSPETTSK